MLFNRPVFPVELVKMGLTYSPEICAKSIAYG